MKTERILLFISFLGIIFKFLDLPLGMYIFTGSMLILALIYFFGGFYFLSDKSIKQQNIFLSITSGMSLSSIIVGILFQVMDWESSKRYLLIGMLTAPILLFVTLFLDRRAKEDLKNYFFQMKIRITVLLLLSVLFYIIY